MGTVQFLSFSLLYTKTLFLFSKASKNCSAPTQQIFFGKAICISSLQKSCCISSIFAQCSKKFCNLSLRICPKVVPTKIDNNFDDIQKVSLIEIREYERNGKFAITGSVDDYRSLCRKAVGIVEETGSNALYLSLGLVRFTPRGSKRDFYAPLFLVPAFSKVKGSNNSYELDLNFDAITINTTLFEYLKQNFLISLDEIYSVNKENLERD